MYIVTVIFEVAPADAAAFRKQILQQAANSLQNETGCKQFDVCFAPDQPNRCFLYEKYDDRAAFETHLASEHFLNFDAAVKSMIVNKEVSIWQQVAN